MITKPALYNLTVRDVIASLQSETCPACGDYKTVRNSVCGGCWRKLPTRLKIELSRQIAPLSSGTSLSSSYRQTMIGVLANLKVWAPVLPGDDRAHSIQHGGIDRASITPEVATRSLACRICPACSRSKLAGDAWCAICTDRLRPKIDRLIAPGGSTDFLFAEKLETVEHVFDGRRLRQQPEEYTASFYRALHALDCSRVYLQREHSREWASQIGNVAGGRQ